MRAAAAGAAVVSLPFNLGIGGAVQTGFKYALEHGYDTVIRLDGDGQHDPQQIPNLLAPLERDEADVVVGSRFAEGGGDDKAPFARRAGIGWFAQLVSLLTRQKLTDTTSGFQAVNARAIRLFAADYPHDYPEVEAAVMVVRHRLRILEVPAQMRGRETGRSSITLLRSLYYAIKVTLALFVGIFRRRVVPAEEARCATPPSPTTGVRHRRRRMPGSTRFAASPRDPTCPSLRSTATTGRSPSA